MRFHPFVYQVVGAVMLIAGAVYHDLMIVVAGGAIAAVGLLAMTLGMDKV